MMIPSCRNLLACCYLVTLLVVQWAVLGQDNAYRLTCYTCENQTDNYNCNRWAIDRPCAPGYGFCLTKHEMDESGGTLSLTKTCSTEDECQWDFVGCYPSSNDPSHLVCTSCCDFSYCNRPVPRNASEAIVIITRRLMNNGQSGPPTPMWLLSCGLSALAMAITYLV